MSWNPTTDSFHFIWSISLLKETTERTVPSTITRLFDPLGFLSSILINAKILIQELWSKNLEWDDSLPAQLYDKWTYFLQQIQELPTLSFSRWLGITSQNSIEIHGFSDASQQALAAVVYLRSIDQDEKVHTSLICSKTKVAPLKRLTITRLELSAVVLLTKLVHHIVQFLNLDKAPVHLCTDSASVYTWISNHTSRLKEFVHKRVCFIQEAVPTAKWHYIPGNENPADCFTRGLTPSQLS
ncbi:uncharacterized protein LOC117183071 [Belonocnema kinseyi]|uniref:uncharacterized protein LOC117183071 n=1 Tax=Belonocnema kinseyi TaxID=2817044 RepID=UPI00143D598D|nr:uncharacterized protein LOC117183071 [Belonocnema kinseyi]